MCGHVNPEQIFDIIDVPVLDGRGKSTGQRRISPKEWNDFYNVLLVPKSGGGNDGDSDSRPLASRWAASAAGGGGNGPFKAPAI